MTTRALRMAAAALVVVAGCGVGASDVTSGTSTPNATSTPTASQTIGEAPVGEPSAAASPGSPDSSQTREKFTASDAIEAIRDAGLELGDERDNTDGNGPSIGCVAVITTDYVSVYEWPTADDAQEYLTLGAGREHVQFARVVLHLGGDSDFWPFDTEPYIRTVRAAYRAEQDRG